VAADIDLRSWLFAFGGGIRIESPDALREELVERCRQAIEANSKQPPPPQQQPSEQHAPRFFHSRLRRD
jgi:hypothetical protein